MRIRKANKKRKIVLLLILLVTFTVSGILAVQKIAEIKAGSDSYEYSLTVAGLELEIESESHTNIEEAAEQEMQLIQTFDLEALKAANEDVMGWILIPGAGISYPLLDGDDNSYYLNTTWDLKKNKMGSIFLEQQCSSDLEDFNTIVYGHNMRSEAMFSNLKWYLDDVFWKEAPYVYIADENHVRKYSIFAAYQVSVNGHAFLINLGDDNDKKEFIKSSVDMSVFNAGIVPSVNDKILTLSTCTGDGHEKRTIVQAVLTSEYKPS